MRHPGETALEKESSGGYEANAPTPQSALTVPEPAALRNQSQDSKKDSLLAPKDADAAVHAFIDAAKTADLKTITRTFAMEDYVNHYNPESKDAKNIRQLSILDRELDAAGQILSFYKGLHLVHDDLENNEDFINSIQDLSLQDLLKPGTYDTLEIVRIDLPESDPQLHSQRISKSILGMTLYGAEGWDYRSALLSLNGETYYCGFKFLIYNGEYKLESLNCPMLGLPWQIVTIPCSAEEYESLLQN